MTPWTAAHQASLSITSSESSPQLISIESMIPSNHLILCRPLLLPPSIFPSIRVFSNKSVLCIRWPKHWSFSFNTSPFNEYSELISFRMDWLDLLAVQGTLKSLIHHPHYMLILVSPELFPLYYLRFTVITSTGLGIFFSAGDPEVQRGKLTRLKLWLGWQWRERDLHLGVTPS